MEQLILMHIKEPWRRGTRSGKVEGNRRLGWKDVPRRCGREPRAHTSRKPQRRSGGWEPERRRGGLSSAAPGSSRAGWCGARSGEGAVFLPAARGATPGPCCVGIAATAAWGVDCTEQGWTGEASREAVGLMRWGVTSAVESRERRVRAPQEAESLARPPRSSKMWREGQLDLASVRALARLPPPSDDPRVLFSKPGSSQTPCPPAPGPFCSGPRPSRRLLLLPESLFQQPPQGGASLVFKR